MKELTKSETLVIPEGVEITIKARFITVTGPRGTLTKNLRHINCEVQRVSKNKISVVVYHGARKHVACIRTAVAHIRNMITGVTKGFLYKMRYVYAHFPINVIVSDDGKNVEVRNFLGEKIIRRVSMLEGVTCEISSDAKDEIIIKGNNIEAVSQSAASIQQSTTVKKKDIRKFLDGIYVSEKTTIVQEE